MKGRELHLCTPNSNDSESLEQKWLYPYRGPSYKCEVMVPCKWTDPSPPLHSCDMGESNTCFADKNWSSVTCLRSSPVLHCKATSHLIYCPNAFAIVFHGRFRAGGTWKTLSEMSGPGDKTAQTFRCCVATEPAWLSFKFSSKFFGRQTKRQTLSIMQFLFS